MAEVLADVAAERAVLAGIYKFGSEAYFDIADILQVDTFTVESNQMIFKCMKTAIEANNDIRVDIPTILSTASELGLSYIFDKKQELLHLQAITNFPVQMSNVRRFAGKIRKLHVTRVIREQLEMAGDRLLDIKGDESLSHIMGVAEDAVFDLSKLINNEDNHPRRLGDGIVEYVQYLADNQVDQIGISTGYKNYDMAIGGGLRGSTINIISARPKTGKTLLSDNMGYYIADHKIPVLNLDTEMRREDHIHRTLAMMTECYIYDIENGKYATKPDSKEMILKAAHKLEEEKTPYYHLSIGGLPLEEQLAVMRRWILKEVGLKPNGKANPCVLIYDYLKLMDSKEISGNMAEFQALGFLLTTLHNFALRYDIPILAFMQLNRDGISKETTDTASGSDRIVWLCSNFTIFKKKSDEEIQEDGPESGNRKLVPVIARHGEWDDRNYINMHMKGYCAKIVEGQTKFELSKNKSTTDEGFEVEDDNGGNDIPFD